MAKKIMEKLNRAQKCLILGASKTRAKGSPGPWGSPGSTPGLASFSYLI